MADKKEAKGGDKHKLSKKGLNLLKELEGEVKLDKKHVPYDDQTGKPIDEYIKGATIGHGLLITSRKELIKYKNGLTDKQAEKLLGKTCLA